MSRSILKQILDHPIENLTKIGKTIPNKASLKLYREILKFSKEMNWTNEKGQQWKNIIRQSARKEFELARDEKDPMLVLKMIITSREAMLQTKDRLNEQLYKINTVYSEKNENSKFKNQNS